MGRKSTFDQKIADQICEFISSGDSMREAGRKLDMDEACIRSWRHTNQEFASQYARAIIERAEVFFERGNDISMTIKNGEGAQIARVQLDWLKWAACKLAPKTYGDKLELAGSVDLGLADRISKARKRNEP